MDSALRAKFLKKFPQAKQGEPLCRHTSLGIGGEASLWLEVQSVRQAKRALRFCRIHRIKCFPMGNGTNVLAADEGFDGVVLHFGRPFSRVKVRGRKIVAQAGASAKSIAQAACLHSLSGAEFLSVLPASVGGVVAMNAGCYGQSANQIVRSVCAVADGRMRRFLLSQCGFGYRSSKFRLRGWTVLKVTFRLRRKPREEILLAQKSMAERKRASQPLGARTAGSTFLADGIPVARRLDELGCKGKRVGQIAVSEKHAGFLVNLGGGTSREWLILASQLGKIYQETFQEKLSMEVVYLGDTNDLGRLSYAHDL